MFGGLRDKVMVGRSPTNPATLATAISLTGTYAVAELAAQEAGDQHSLHL